MKVLKRAQLMARPMEQQMAPLWECLLVQQTALPMAPLKAQRREQQKVLLTEPPKEPLRELPMEQRMVLLWESLLVQQTVLPMGLQMAQRKELLLV